MIRIRQARPRKPILGHSLIRPLPPEVFRRHEGWLSLRPGCYWRRNRQCTG